MVCSMIEYSLRVERIVKTFGMVNANPETIKGSECITIINGFSNLMMEVYNQPQKYKITDYFGSNTSRCLAPRRAWEPGAPLVLPRCPTIAQLRWSASSR